MNNFGNYDKPFGGVNVILMGDMFQMKPTSGISLYNYLSTEHNINLLLRHSQIINLNQQMRAAEDEIHANFVKSFRSKESD